MAKAKPPKGGKGKEYGCPKAIGECQDKGDGTCSFCGRRIAAPPKMPKKVDRTELGEAYRRHYDPDYGNDPRDV